MTVPEISSVLTSTVDAASGGLQLTLRARHPGAAIRTHTALRGVRFAVLVYLGTRLLLLDSPALPKPRQHPGPPSLTQSRRCGEEFSRFTLHGFSDYSPRSVVASLDKKLP